MKTQKGIIHLGLILVVLVFGIGALVFVMYKTNSLPVVTTGQPPNSLSPTPETVMQEDGIVDNWLDYSHQNLGLQLQYPEGYTIEEQNDLGLNEFRAVFKNAKATISSFSVFVGPDPGSLPQYPYDHKPTGEYSVAGARGIYLELPEGYSDGLESNPPPLLSIYFRNGGKFYKVNFYGISDIHNQNINQILSTFEFVGQDNPRTTWKTYTDPTHNFIINYPASYTVSGQLAANLQDWRAAKGITISSPNNPAKPEVFIEAVFDGYGPIFPTGNIDASFSANKLVVFLDKKDDQEYKQMVDNGLVLSGNELYLSKIIHHGDIPFWFQIKHKDRGNTELDNELKEILSTFQFNN